MGAPEFEDVAGVLGLEGLEARMRHLLVGVAGQVAPGQRGNDGLEQVRGHAGGLEGHDDGDIVLAGQPLDHDFRGHLQHHGHGRSGVVAIAEAGETGQSPVVELLAVGQALDLVIGDLPLLGIEAGAVANTIVDDRIDLACGHRIDLAVHVAQRLQHLARNAVDLAAQGLPVDVGAAAQVGGDLGILGGALHQLFQRSAIELGIGITHEAHHRRGLAMFDESFSDPLGQVGAAGNGDTVLFALAADDVDQVVIAEHTGEFEQRPGHLDDVIGQLDQHRARRPLQRRQELGDMHPCLHLDQFGQLAQHFVILGDLIVVAAVRHIAEQLRRGAEQLLALELVVLAVENAEIRERPVALFEFGHGSISRLLPLQSTQTDPDLLVGAESGPGKLNQIVRKSA